MMPDKIEEAVRDLREANTPPALRELDQWQACYRKGEDVPTKAGAYAPALTAKRPIGGPKSMTEFDVILAKAVTEERLMGFCVTADDDMVCIDVDHLPTNWGWDDLPAVIRQILDIAPTYWEVSPSGQGIHIYYKTDRAKQASRSAQDHAIKDFEGSVFFRSQFVTVTGSVFSTSSDVSWVADVADVAWNIFEGLLLEVSASVLTVPDSGGTLSAPTYNIKNVENWLFTIPPNLSESSRRPLIDKAYASFTPPIKCPEDYTHWQYCAAATHFACDRINAINEGEDIFVEWSLQGDNDGEEEIRNKYRENAPKYDGKDLTEKTLIALANAMQPAWPYPKIKTVKGVSVATNMPDTSALLNWEMLLELHDVHLMFDEIGKDYHFVSFHPIIGDRVNKTAFKGSKKLDSLEAVQSQLFDFVQRRNFMASDSHTRTAARQLVEHNHVAYNPMRDRIDRAQREDPLASGGVGYFDKLWGMITVAKRVREGANAGSITAMYKSYFKKNLMGIIRSLYYKGRWSESTGIVSLQGREKSRKSSFLENLLPRDLSQYVVASQVEATAKVKEMQIEVGCAVIWIRNEIDSFYSQGSSSAIKNFTGMNHDFYRPLFGKKAVKIPRSAILFGTFNPMEIEISDSGSRRTQLIPVDFCDTEALEKMDENGELIKVYQELLNEFQASSTPESLWVLTDDEQRLTDKLNAQWRTEGDLTSSVTSAFDYESEFDRSHFIGPKGGMISSNLTALTDVVSAVREANPDGKYKGNKAIKHEVKRLTSTWAGFEEGANLGMWTLETGMWTYRPNGPGTKVAKSGFMMPPKTVLFAQILQ